VSGLSSILLTALFDICPCRSQITGTTFVLKNSDRVAGKMSASATISFTTSWAAKLPVGSKITLSYPAGFFAVSSTPAVAISSGATGSAAAPNATFIVITTGTVAINASTNVTITLTGLTMGAATGGNSSGITISTSADLVSSLPIPSGPILSFFTPLPPITAGLIAHYSADSWTGSQWFDLSGTENHVTEVGGTSIAVARPVGAPAYIYGASTAWMKFPVGILPSADYTLFYVARYNGAAKQRIFQGLTSNWLSGFHNVDGVKIGVAHHGSCGWITPTTSDSSDNWVLGSDRRNSFRSNGRERAATNICAVFDRLVVNGFVGGEASDFAIQSVLVYNVKLSDADVQRVEAWLQAQQAAFTPASLQVCPAR